MITATKILSSRLAGLGSIIATYIYLIVLPGKAQSIWLWLTNAIIIMVSCVFIFSAPERSISIIKVCGVFFLLFFGITPILEYKLSVNYWGGSNILSVDYIFANIIIIISTIIFWFVYKISYSFSKPVRLPANDYILAKASTSKLRFYRFLVPLITSLFIIIWFNNFNIYNLLFRGGELVGDVAVDSKAIGLIVNNFLRPFCFSSAIFCIFILRQHSKSNLIWCTIFLIFAFLACFPTSLARFAIAALYIPLLLITFPSILDKGLLAINIFILSFITVFPFFNSFRNVNQDFSLENIEFGFDFNFFVAGHFDAYQNFVRTIALDVVTDGMQLLGALLFFVPRALWINKPTGSGELLAQKANLSFSNIAQSLPAEGYTNFGVMGVFLFLAVAAYCAAKLDHGFWRNQMSALRSTYSLYYFQIIGLTIFIMRGDLLNAIAYTSGFLSAMMVISLIYKSRSIRVGSSLIW